MISLKRALLVVAASVLPMAASAAVIASGVKVITGTYLFDFDTGTQSFEGQSIESSPGMDVWWEQINSTTRQLTPINGALIVNLGTVNFSSLTLASLQALSYSTTPISGGNVGNQLTYGDVFAIKTSDGNYAKAIVSFPFFDASQNNGLPIYFETFSSPVPEAGSFMLTLAGLGAVGFLGSRRRKLAQVN